MKLKWNLVVFILFYFCCSTFCVGTVIKNKMLNEFIYFVTQCVFRYKKRHQLHRSNRKDVLYKKLDFDLDETVAMDYLGCASDGEINLRNFLWIKI